MNRKSTLVIIFFSLSLFSCKTVYKYDRLFSKTTLCTTVYFDSTGGKMTKITKLSFRKKCKTEYYANGEKQKKGKTKSKSYGLFCRVYIAEPYGTYKYWNEDGELIRKEKYSRINHDLKKSKSF